MKRHLLLMLFLIQGLAVRAGDDGVEMADTMRAEGKIYIVAGVMTIIFTVILIYLVLLNRKITSLERKIKNPGAE